MFQYWWLPDEGLWGICIVSGTFLSKYTLDFIVHKEIASAPTSLSQGSLRQTSEKFTVDRQASSFSVTFVASNAAKSSPSLG